MRRKTAAINRPIRRFQALCSRIHAKAQRDIVETGKPRSKNRHRRARIEMRFGRKKQGVVKTPFEIGLERRYSCCVNWLEASSAAGKTGELRPVAGGATTSDPCCLATAMVFRPELKRFEAEIENELFGALGLAPGRQHATRKIGTAETWTLTLLDHFNVSPAWAHSKATVRPATPAPITRICMALPICAGV